MTDAIVQFFAAWSETDADRRAEAIRNAVEDGVMYADPRTEAPITDVSALADYVAGFASNSPGWAADVVRTDETAGTHRVTVNFHGPGPDGAEMSMLGQYFAELESDRIRRLIGFAGTGNPE